MHAHRAARPRGVRRARRVERQLDRPRRRRGRDARLAARLRARGRHRRALGGDRGQRGLLRPHQADPQLPARLVRRRRRPRRRRAPRLRRGDRAQRRRVPGADQARGRGDHPRPAAGRPDPGDPRDRLPDGVALSRRPRPARRARAQGVGVPDPLRPRRGRLRLLARGLRVGGARQGGHDHPALDRRLLAQEPGARPRARALDPHRRRAQRGRRGRRADLHALGREPGPRRPRRSALGAAPAALVRPRRGPGLALGRAQGPDRGDPGLRAARRAAWCPTRTSSTPGRLSSR